ncbi:MAG: methyltransferase domain-containing protein [Holophaga sp.]|nr:methyltransferase domain-containing protein [Holophaga sp.]
MDSARSFATADVAPFRNQWIDPFLFARQAMASPRRFGAILPSGSALGHVMARMVRGHTIVELGPGSGSITRHLLNGLGPAGRILALELDEGIAAHLQQNLRDPRLTVQVGDASHLDGWLSAMGWDGADSIVSGIPFQSIPAPARDAVLSSARRSLSPTGRFIAFQYGLRLLPTFREHFRRVRVIGPIWRNLPPAYVVVGHP